MKLLAAAFLIICCTLVTANFVVYIPKDKDCILTKDPGYCWFSETRYAYDMLKGKCVKFQYTGCGGNNNRFKSKSKCLAKCIIGDSSESVESSENSGSIWDW